MVTARQQHLGWRLRAAVGVLALYGLVLQALLAGMVPGASAPGLLCGVHAPERSDPAPPAPHPCCAASCPGSASSVPPGAVPVLRPRPDPVPVAWTTPVAPASHPVRAHPATARGPPPV
ncbi:hypothetical protein [Methylobacterium sp. JK268]